MKTHSSTFLILCVFYCFSMQVSAQDSDIPLPEHPRPDFQREQWLNLNGSWNFQFDPGDHGVSEQWFQADKVLGDSITVPFSWAAPMSGQEDEADIGWYNRSLEVPPGWQGKRIFLVIGASDWHTTMWLDGKKVGDHKGGYTPFEFELTNRARAGTKHSITLRVDDTKQAFKLEGKQGYGPARGIWQTVYLEARGAAALEYVHFVPDIDSKTVTANVVLMEQADSDCEITLSFPGREVAAKSAEIAKGQTKVGIEVTIPEMRLWSLNDPYLYDVAVSVTDESGSTDKVSSYFGMRKISVVDLPGTDIPYIALNNKPVYLQMSLDQAYHPEGFYTWPSDSDMREEILLSRRLGLNGQRIHVKIGVPRKLYWADKLGILIMADVPNSWGEPDADMQRETEYAMRQMIRRDFNHPAIFSWVIFNETWGLMTNASDRKKRVYTKETQKWVESMYYEAKKLDPTRLVEDNSPNKKDHVITDINSWHAYLPGYAWRSNLDRITAETYPGSQWNYVEGRKQDREPNLNSECGNVWGYEGSTGDVDWSWDYHIMINEFRRHPKICGWLYTEHHDVINEWNGYVRYDRSRKFTGMGDLAYEMSMRDLHSPYYIAVGDSLCQTVTAGATVDVPMWLSIMTDENPADKLLFRTELYGWDQYGKSEVYGTHSDEIKFEAWASKALPAQKLVMPDHAAVAVLAVYLETLAGVVLNRNFTTFDVRAVDDFGSEYRYEKDGITVRTLTVAPSDYSARSWSQKTWQVFDGLKINGAGAGYFEYRIAWPGNLRSSDISSAVFRAELSAKKLLGKDMDSAGRQQGNFMLGKGTHDPGLNPNAYPMTDETPFPSAVQVSVSGMPLGVFELPDDPADHRGILSWHSQKKDRHLHEAGSYGYLISVPLRKDVVQKAEKKGELLIRLQVDDSLPGGLAIYGKRFGRYPLDPSVSFVLDGK